MPPKYGGGGGRGGGGGGRGGAGENRSHQVNRGHSNYEGPHRQQGTGRGGGGGGGREADQDYHPYGRVPPNELVWVTGENPNPPPMPTGRTCRPLLTNPGSINAGQLILQNRARDNPFNTEFPLRKKQGEATGRKVSIVTNHLSFNVDSDFKIHQYQIVGMSNSYGKATKRILVERMIQQSAWLQTLNGRYATDHELYIYTWDKHKTDSEIDPVQVKASYKKDPVSMHLVHQGEVDLSLLDLYAQGRHQPFTTLGANQLPIKAELEQKKTVANTLISPAIGTNLFIPKANKFFVQDGIGLISKSLCLTRGYSYAARPGMHQQLLNINACTSAFFRPILVSDFLRDTYSFSAGEEREKMLKGLRVQLMYTPDCEKDKWTAQDKDDMKFKIIHKVGTESVDSQIFHIPGPNNTAIPKNVGQHFRSTYPNHTLDHTNLKAINCGSKDHPKWYPPEMLRIVPGQIYKKILPSRFTPEMINRACHRPEDTRALIEFEGIAQLGLTDSNQKVALASCPGIKIQSRLLQIDAKILEMPSIRYKSGIFDLDQLEPKWNMAKRQPFITTQRCFKVHVIIVPGRDRTLNESEAGRIMAEFCRRADTEYGIARFHPTTTYATEPQFQDRHKADKAMKFAKDNKADLVVLLMDQKNIPMYSLFKDLADRWYDVHALCLTTAGGNKNWGSPDLWGNIMMKVNLKAGGGNHTAKGVEDVMKDTLVLGADVTHAGPGALAGTPSIAAIVGSVDQWGTKFLGSMRLQKRLTACEDITNVKDMVKERLDDWSYYHANELPKKILYYRDGVSESQYLQVLENEVRQIREAFALAVDEVNAEAGLADLKIKDSTKTSASPAYKASDLRITAVVVGKRHHVRFFPKDRKDSAKKNNNCLPGTLVDSVVTSPYFSDFYLQTHDAIKGTAKPAHYFPLINEIGLTEAQLQDFTYKLSYTYVRATTPVSYAPPAYYADRLCERGRCYLRDYFVPTDNDTKRQHNTDMRKIVKDIEDRRGTWPDTTGMDKAKAEMARMQHAILVKQDKDKLELRLKELVFNMASADFYGKDKDGKQNPEATPWSFNIGETMFWM